MAAKILREDQAFDGALGEFATRFLPSPEWVVTHNSKGVQLFVDFEGGGVGSNPGEETHHAGHSFP